jgi:ubiquinone biosynthesis protein Coq4
VKLIFPSPFQAEAVTQAMQAVISAEGRVAPLPVEIESIHAIERHLLHVAESFDPPGHTLPHDFAAIIDSPLVRQETVRILALLPVLDGRVLPGKVAVVEHAARLLDVQDRGLVILRQAARRQYKRIGMAILSRSVAHYWSPTGKARLRDWLDMLRLMLPPIPGIYSMLTDKPLLAKYQALAAKPRDTLGYVLHQFYTKRGFALPGEPKSFPEGWGKHEVYHVLSEYDTSLQGEMLNAAFSGGNTEKLCMDLLLATLLQFHAGRQVLPGPCVTNLLQPDAFFRAVARGAAMNTDLLRGWDLWSVVDRPLQELREALQIPALTGQEREMLAASEALLT